MSNRKNQILVGLIIVAMGLFTLFGQWISIPFIRKNNLFGLFIATTLLLLYCTKKKTWALVAGMFIGFFSVLGIFPNVNFNTATFIAPMVFILPGFIFIILYYSKYNIGFLIPGSILMWFGIFIFLVTSGLMRGMMIPVAWFGSLGAAFLSMYLLGRHKIGKWPLIPGGILLGMAFLLFAGASLGFIFRLGPKLIPVTLIIIGLFIVIKSRKSN
ncbi:MAG TPA: hypothetical protein PLL17_08485 [Defluviitaleaceae bacterium]|jgi:hypothetical protein|nr:hypothetical protein [Defluviitaleaceae bacterium]HQD51147.1 hypothetical protein [Defluviitaleaceae bacterium]